MSKYLSSIEDLDKIYVSRSMLQRWIHSPIFGSLIVGFFVKIPVGVNPEDPTKSLYRIAEIVGVTETPKKYQFGQQLTSIGMILRHAKSTKVFSLEHASNSKFTQEEFDRWLRKCKEGNIEVPTLKHIRKKLEDVDAYHFLEYDLNAAEDESDSKVQKTGSESVPATILNNEVPPENLVFSIDLLHSMILKNLSSADWFQTCRLVNSHWSSVATKFIKGLRFGPSIQFTFDLDANCYLHQLILSSGEMTEETLENLVELISYTVPGLEFPCNDFRFSGGHLADVQIQQFLTTHGSLIKKLTLNLSDDDEFDSDCDDFSTLESFTKLLTVNAPNLQYLGMDYFPTQWTKTLQTNGRVELFPSSLAKAPVYLPNLKTLDFEIPVPPEILLDLLRACVKLEELFIPELNEPLVTYLIDTDRLHLLRTFFTFNCTPKNLSAYEKFAEAKLKLLKIELDVSFFSFERPFWPRIARCLSSIFASGSESLQRMFWCPIGHLPGLYIPPLNNVWTLSIQDCESKPDIEALFNEGVQSERKLFPAGIKMKSIFPNLSAIDLVNRSSFDDNLIDNFEPLPKVKKISISHTNCFSTEIIDKFAAMFPNVIEGTFKGIHNFPKVAKAIWKFKKLEELELGFTVGCNCKGNAYPALDVGLTGLTQGTCRMLLIMDEIEIGEQLDQTLFRENSSLLDLKELESLSLEFTDDGDEMQDADCTSLLTDLTGKYAFELLSNVDISIKIAVEELSNFSKIKNSLEQIRPYVTSGPW